MKKIVLFFIHIFTGLTLFCSDFDKNTIINSIQKDLANNFTIIDYAYGNFLSSKENSLAVFCDKKRLNIEKNEVVKIFIYKINKASYELWGELKADCCFFEKTIDEYYKQVGINQSFPELGEAHHFGWVGDFNGNGITEMMFYKSAYSAEGATLEFWEYFDSTFICTLKAQDDVAFIIQADKKNKTLSIERYKFSYVIEDYEVKNSKILWDSSKKMYIEKQMD